MMGLLRIVLLLRWLVLHLLMLLLLLPLLLLFLRLQNVVHNDV